MAFKLFLNGKINGYGERRHIGKKYKYSKTSYNPPIFIKRTKVTGDTKHKRYYALYKCQCGKQFEARMDSVNDGGIKSCGCHKKRMLKFRKGYAHSHGHASNGKPTRTYNIWASMHQRCYDPNHKFYYRYGGRGITVCKRWNDFQLFLDDMGEVPKRLTIERVNNNKGYYKQNCRWATQKEQRANTSTTLFINYNNEKITLKNALEKYNSPVKYHTAFWRLKQGWSLQDVLFK